MFQQLWSDPLRGVTTKTTTFFCKILRNEWYYVKVLPKWFIWIVTWGLSSQVSKLVKERNNLVILNAVLNWTSWSWDLHSPKAHCGVPTTADTGCCALEIGKYQPQYRNQQRNFTQQHFIWSPARLNYCTHPVKTKRGNYNVQDQKRG